MVLKNFIDVSTYRYKPLPRITPNYTPVIHPALPRISVRRPLDRYKPCSYYHRKMGENLTIGNAKPKVVLFYKNGDRNFRGYHVTVTPRRFRNFDNLLSELTRVTNLAQGARFIFTPSTGKRIETLDELTDGKSYVCGSFPKLKKINYGCRPDGSERKRPTNKGFMPSTIKQTLRIENERSVSNIKPRIVTIIRNGISKPRRSVKILLNKRTAQTYEQVLNDVTSSVGIEGGSGIRKLFNLDGKLVLGLTELFGQDDVFIAVGNEKFRPSDIPNIIDDFGLQKGLRSKSSSQTTTTDSPAPLNRTPKPIFKTFSETIKRPENTPDIIPLKKLPDIKRKTKNKTNTEKVIETHDSVEISNDKENIATNSGEHITFDEADIQEITGIEIQDEAKPKDHESFESMSNRSSDHLDRSIIDNDTELAVSNHSEDILSEKK